MLYDNRLIADRINKFWSAIGYDAEACSSEIRAEVPTSIDGVTRNVPVPTVISNMVNGIPQRLQDGADPDEALRLLVRGQRPRPL